MWLRSLQQYGRAATALAFVRLAVLTAALLFAGRTLRVSLRALKITILVVLAIALVIVLIGNTVFRGDRDIAYRFAAPDAPERKVQESKPILLASDDPRAITMNWQRSSSSRR